ncbi:hypothetical protein P3X46_017955 [Hevea brasiliensis]|uniref:Glycosyltransferase n=1 Tax=Hevea brasiliensis TaxID=3981 RepID=A0ABQ9LP96_HEVBR|nr:anthocyanidin-3-O-glucoside rhamnosyltransferase [Hevea brasiliensis]KAJ9169804.1 hypothetical protein P3X46_017955 [Hevea brasiliensis]
MNKQSAAELHVLMFPYFAFGHISPFVQLSNKLSLHGVRVSFLSAPGNIPRIKSSLLLTPNAQIIPIQLPPVEGLPPGLDSTSEMTPHMAELLKKALDLMQPQIKTLLSQLNPDFVFIDFAQYWLPKLASELGIKTVCFSVFSAISGAFLTVPARDPGNKIPTVDDISKPPNGFPLTLVTSVQTFQAQDFWYLYKSFDGGPSAYHRVCQSISGCTALAIKTCNEMEGPYVDFMKSQHQKPVLLTGPLVPEPASGVLEEKWAKWLGQFPLGSVIFCSFGSETFLDDNQIEQLALGLELTGLPFILVLNFPAGVDTQAELNRALPKGFLERVKDRGILHSGWVQQPLILANASVGCYLCHSGFSSLIEGLMNDCQLVLLPLKGDQFLNSKVFAGDMKAGVEVNRRNEDGYFGKDDINEAVRIVMMEIEKDPCKSIRSSHKKWREFLLNRDIQNKYIADMVEKLKALA